MEVAIKPLSLCMRLFGNNVIDRLEQKFADQYIPDQNIKNGKDQIKV
jgi:hypothetical protein